MVEQVFEPSSISFMFILLHLIFIYLFYVYSILQTSSFLS